jgi:hypothetical protein
VFDAFGCDQLAGQFFEALRFSSQHNDFEAVVMVEVDVKRRQNLMEMVMLQLGQRLLHARFVVVVN